MSHYTTTETGGHLPSVVASILLHMDVNQEEAYQKISSILNKLVEIVQATDQEAFLHDLTLCILYMCKVRIYHAINSAHGGGRRLKKEIKSL